MELQVSPYLLGYHYDRGIAEHPSHNLTLTLSIGTWEQKSKAEKGAIKRPHQGGALWAAGRSLPSTCDWKGEEHKKSKSLICHQSPLHHNHTLCDKGLVPEEDSWPCCTPRGPWSNRLRTLVLNTTFLYHNALPAALAQGRRSMLLRRDAFHCKFSGPQSNLKTCWSPRPSPLQSGTWA